MQQTAMRKQLNEMNLRIEENDKYRIDLLRRKEKADKSILYWRNRIVESQLSNNNNNYYSYYYNNNSNNNINGFS